MSYTMIKNCKMDWETEEHRFTFVTGGDSLTALDSLNDLIGSLKDLYKHIQEEVSLNKPLPMEINVSGSQMHTGFK